MGDGPKRVCGFCLKPDAEVDRLIEGPITSICNDCVENCVLVLKTPKGTPPSRPYSEFRAEVKARLAREDQQ